VKLIYAMAFALFPLTAAGQSPDLLLLTALCHDDYFEDTAGRCNSLAAVEATLAHYGEIISSDADDESVFYLTDPEETQVGAIEPRQVTPSDNALARKDDESTLTNPENAVAAQIITVGSPHEKDEDVIADADGLGATGSTPAGVSANTRILPGEEPMVE
jgi:hypothetical protein